MFIAIYVIPVSFGAYRDELLPCQCFHGLFPDRAAGDAFLKGKGYQFAYEDADRSCYVKGNYRIILARVESTKAIH